MYSNEIWSWQIGCISFSSRIQESRVETWTSWSLELFTRGGDFQKRVEPDELLSPQHLPAIEPNNDAVLTDQCPRKTSWHDIKILQKIFEKLGKYSAIQLAPVTLNTFLKCSDLVSFSMVLSALSSKNILYSWKSWIEIQSAFHSWLVWGPVLPPSDLSDVGAERNQTFFFKCSDLA